MVIRTRMQRILQAMALYAFAAAAIAYFGFHAYHGDHGIRAKQALIAEVGDLTSTLQTLQRERAGVERMVRLMSSEALDPDLLDQRAREVLNFADPKDLVFIEGRR